MRYITKTTRTLIYIKEESVAMLAQAQSVSLCTLSHAGWLDSVAERSVRTLKNFCVVRVMSEMEDFNVSVSTALCA